jgi:hypothetical protein
VIAVHQLQKPTIIATLVSRFNKSIHSSTVVDHTQRLSAVARRRPFDVGNGIHTVVGGSLFVEPVGMTLTKSDEIVVSNAGDCSVSVMDPSGHFLRRLEHAQYTQHQPQGVTTADMPPSFASHKECAANGFVLFGILFSSNRLEVKWTDDRIFLNICEDSSVSFVKNWFSKFCLSLSRSTNGLRWYPVIKEVQ